MGRERNFFLAVAVSGLGLTACSVSTPAADAAVADATLADASLADTNAPDDGVMDAEVSTADADGDAFVLIL